MQLGMFEAGDEKCRLCNCITTRETGFRTLLKADLEIESF